MGNYIRIKNYVTRNPVVGDQVRGARLSYWLVFALILVLCIIFGELQGPQEPVPGESSIRTTRVNADSSEAPVDYVVNVGRGVVALARGVHALGKLSK
jgi:hypothetical protein